MTFQEFDRLIKATSKYEVFSQFAAAEGSAFLTKEDASFIWEFGRNPSFSTIRQLSGLSQAKFALAYPPKQRSLENWDTGKRTPSANLIPLLAFAVFSDFCSR